MYKIDISDQQTEIIMYRIEDTINIKTSDTILMRLLDQHFEPIGAWHNDLIKEYQVPKTWLKIKPPRTSKVSQNSIKALKEHNFHKK